VTSGFTALVLAGNRADDDPVASYAGVLHKGLIRLKGETLLARVVRALEGAGASRICIATNHPAVIAEAQGLETRASIEVMGTQDTPSLSVLDAAVRLGTPLLVTTADHALLEPEWIRQFLLDAPQGADIALLLAPEAVVAAAAPTTRRTYLRFRDGRYSGCNLFLLGTPRALGAIRFWSRLEALRKTPWRVALALGPLMLAAYGLRLSTLDGMMQTLGRKAGVSAAAVRSPYGLAAIDVDKPGDLDLVRRLTET
jgi:GTP:adenosylcobinamide-phosphate guanylyltransferase